MLPYHTLVGPAESSSAPSPDRYMLVLHGIYGSGGNWRTFARKLHARLPDWGFALVDLRMHGRSQGAEPPHTVAAAAEDLQELSAHLAREGKTVAAVCGHSFGGKVALAYADARGSSLERAFVLDSSPDARAGAMLESGNTVVGVLRVIEQLPARFDDRAAFVTLLRELGHSQALATWLAMNLEPVEGGLRFRLEPSAMRALLDDYYARDLGATLDSPACPLHFIAAGRGSSLHEPARSRVAALAAKPGSRVTLDVIENAGHWLHVDALDALLELVAARLR